MRYILITIGILCFLSSCIDVTKVAPEVSNLLVKGDVSRLEYGRELYITNCTRCHNALRITRYTETQWAEILPDMFDKTKLSANQTHAVTSYIHAVLLAASMTTE